MSIKLIDHGKLSTIVLAVRTCWSSENKGGKYPYPTDSILMNDRELIHRVGVKNRHASTLEHVSYTFRIEGISRALLQELARHRIASYSVQSSRYTLKKHLRHEEAFVTTALDTPQVEDIARATNYVVFSEDEATNLSILNSLESLRRIVNTGASNDTIKYAIPEAYKTTLVWSINMRSLQNFLALRTAKSAWPEIRKFANDVYTQLPEEHKYMYESFIPPTKEKE